MTGHDPRAADVLALSRAHTGRRDRPDLIDRRGAFHALNALTAAGLVVRPADEYEQVGWHWSDDCCNRPVLDNAFRRAEVADLLAERDRLAAALAAIAALHETDEDNHCVTCSPQDGGRPCCTLREILDLRYEEAQP